MRPDSTGRKGFGRICRARRSSAGSRDRRSDRLAVERGWRLVSLTKSGCGAADVLQYNVNFKRAYTECATWREASFRRAESEHPALVLVASSRASHAVGADGTSDVTGVDAVEPWRAGMDRTLRRLAGAAGSVVLIGDTPRSDVDVPVCLSAHRDDVLAWATPVEDAISRSWLATERDVAAATAVGFVDPTPPWVCPSNPCPAVIGNFIVFRDEHHLTSQFSSALGRLLGDALRARSAKP